MMGDKNSRQLDPRGNSHSVVGYKVNLRILLIRNLQKENWMKVHLVNWLPFIIGET